MTETLAQFNIMQRDRDAQGEPDPKEEWPVCPHCNGEGRNWVKEGLEWKSRICRKCKGKGQV